MASGKTQDDTPETVSEADFAKALQELARGEQTATALENQLTTMEAKIEQLLAQAEREKEDRQGVTSTSTTSDDKKASK